MDIQSARVVATNEIGVVLKIEDGKALMQFYEGSCCSRTEMIPMDRIEMVSDQPTQAECCDECKH